MHKPSGPPNTKNYPLKRGKKSKPNHPFHPLPPPFRAMPIWKQHISKRGFPERCHMSTIVCPKNSWYDEYENAWVCKLHFRVFFPSSKKSIASILVESSQDTTNLRKWSRACILDNKRKVWRTTRAWICLHHIHYASVLQLFLLFSLKQQHVSTIFISFLKQDHA